MVRERNLSDLYIEIEHGANLLPPIIRYKRVFIMQRNSKDVRRLSSRETEMYPSIF